MNSITQERKVAAFRENGTQKLLRKETESGAGLSWSRYKNLIGKDDINLDKNL